MPDMVKRISQIFADRVFHVPDYQRGYAWEQRQWDDLMEDLELLPAGRNHFTGTLVLRTRNDGTGQILDRHMHAYESYDIIDGQQRLTTVVILLKAIDDEMETLPQLHGLADRLRETYLHHIDRNGQPFTKLTLNADSQNFFADNLLGLRPGIGGPAIRSHERLLGARDHFDAYLARKRKELGGSYPEWLQELYGKVTLQLNLIVYPVDDQLDAGIIFETMNDRGKPLTELELVKNYLLYLASKLELPAGHDLNVRINDTWRHIYASLMDAGLGGRLYEDQLLRSHWLMAYDYNPKNWLNNRSIKNRFSLRAYRQRHFELLQDLIDYLDTLKNATTAYCDIFSPERDSAFNDIGDSQLHQEITLWSVKLARLGPRASFLPVLIAVRLMEADGGKSYLDAVKLCERYDFRVYQWLRARSNAGESLLFRLGYQFFHSPEIERLRDDLARATLTYCPDARFKERFDQEKVDWYHWSGITYTLFEYEHHLAGGRPVQMSWESISARKKADSVEHILPQSPDKKYWQERFTKEQRERWMHDIGNLTLTYDNSKLGNDPFPDKRGKPGQVGFYAGSPLFIERQLAAYDDWTEIQIIERREAVKTWAIQRWHVDPPAQKYTDTLPAKYTMERILAVADQHGVGEELRMILDTVQLYGIYPTPKIWCVLLAPPQNHLLALTTIWPEAGRLRVGVWHENWPKYMAIPEDEVYDVLGEERWRTLDITNLDKFVAGLIQLLDKTGDET